MSSCPPLFLLQIPNLNLPAWLGLENLNENAGFFLFLFSFYTSGPFSKWPDGASLSTVLIAKQTELDILQSVWWCEHLSFLF